MKWNKKVKNLVIGGNLAALEFAFREGFPVFYDKLEVPFRLEQTKEGTNKKDLIQNYAFLLSIAGLNYNNYLIGEFRLEKNSLFIHGKKPWKYEINFENLHDFRENESSSKYKIVDYINVRSCGNHDIRELKTENEFAKEIYFYPSQRVNSSKNFNLMTHDYEKVAKDAMVVSYLTREEANKEEHSPIYSRLRLLELMKEIGIKGKKRGTRPNGNIIYSSIVLEFSKREILEIEKDERNYYYSASKKKYLNKIYGYMYGKRSFKAEKN